MTDETYYEWGIEEREEWGDVIDTVHADRVRDLIGFGYPGRLVLIWNTGNDYEGITDRSWAYVEDGVLPDEFENGVRVPKRFHQELVRAAK